VPVGARGEAPRGVGVPVCDDTPGRHPGTYG